MSICLAVRFSVLFFSVFLHSWIYSGEFQATFWRAGYRLAQHGMVYCRGMLTGLLAACRVLKDVDLPAASQLTLHCSAHNSLHVHVKDGLKSPRKFRKWAQLGYETNIRVNFTVQRITGLHRSVSV